MCATQVVPEAPLVLHGLRITVRCSHTQSSRIIRPVATEYPLVAAVLRPCIAASVSISPDVSVEGAATRQELIDVKAEGSCLCYLRHFDF